jgi:general secretion pathway protein I
MAGIFGACGKHDRRKIPLGLLASSPPLEKGEANSPFAPAPSTVTGFTLIEILVALTILAIALAAAVRAASVATDSAQETRLRTIATWIAQNRVAELTATNVFPPAGTISGRGSMAGIEFEWQQVTTETPNAAFRKVELKILRPAQAQSLVTLNAYLARPPGSGS